MHHQAAILRHFIESSRKIDRLCIEIDAAACFIMLGLRLGPANDEVPVYNYLVFSMSPLSATIHLLLNGRWYLVHAFCDLML